MALIANSAEDHADQLTLLTERLTDLMDKERSCLDRNDLVAAGALTEEIGKLAGVYRIETQRVRDQPHFLSTLPNEFKDRLRIATERFRQNLGEHEASLRRARMLTEGLVKAVAEEVARSKPMPMGYSANGRTPVLTGSLAMNSIA
jgi:hypothetical protein